MTKEKHTEILISIRPKYATAIIEGRKTVEYRRSLPLKNNIQKMWIYATQPIGLVLGTAYVHVWMDAHITEEDISRGLLTVDEFNEYFKGAKHRWSLEIKKVVPFDIPITLQQLGISRPPQSWMYLKNTQDFENKTTNKVMTKEQIEICREYLEIVDLMKNWWKTNTTWSPYNQRRADIHFELLRIYGFDCESDTLGVTDSIPDGMTPRELHEQLMALKNERQNESHH